MPIYNPENLQVTTENGATSNIQVSLKNATSDIPGLVVDVTDTTGFAQAFKAKLGGTDWLYLGTIFGFNGIINLFNNSFFFGNSNALNFYLINTALSVHTISVVGSNYNFYTSYLDLGAKNLQSTGTFTDGSTPIVSGHKHLGTGNEGAVIPHANSQPVRALDTVYTNSSVRPIIVWGSVECTVKNGGDVAMVDLKTDASNPPTTIVQTVGVDWRSGAITDIQTYHHGFYMVVQPSHRYEIVTNVAGGGTVAITYWNETDF